MASTPPSSGAGSGAGYASSPRLPQEDLSSDRLIAGLKRDESGRPVLGGIPLICRIGKGGMGAVYYGIHPRLKVEVAVKILPFHLLDQDPRLADRFITEARLAASLHSDHVVRVLDVDQDQGTHYIEMEYVFGESAGAFLRRRTRLTENETLAIITAATRGLAAAHEHGIVHRDVKPDNILLPRGRSNELELARAKLSDLGLAKPENSAFSMGTTPQIAMGTPGYMAPEQIEDAKSAGFPADVFSMGATIYALLGGNAPFAGTSLGVILRDTATKEPDPLPAGVRQEVRALVARCLQKQAPRRYSDGGHLLRALEMITHAAALQADIRTLLTIPDEEKQATRPTVLPETLPPQQFKQPPALDLPPTILPVLPHTIAPPPPRGGRGALWAVVVLLLLVIAGAAVAIPLYLGKRKTEEAQTLRDKARDLDREWGTLALEPGADAKSAKKALDEGEAQFTAGRDDDAIASFKLAQTAYKAAIENGKQFSEVKKIRAAVDEKIKKFDPAPVEAVRHYVKGNDCIAQGNYEGAKAAFGDAEKAVAAYEIELGNKIKVDALAAQERAQKAQKEFDANRGGMQSILREFDARLAAIDKRLAESPSEEEAARLQEERSSVSAMRYGQEAFLDGFVKHILSSASARDVAAKMAVGDSQMQDVRYAAAMASYKEAMALFGQLGDLTKALETALKARRRSFAAYDIIFATINRLYQDDAPAPSPRQTRAIAADTAAYAAYEQGDFAKAAEHWGVAEHEYEDMVLNVPAEVNDIQKAIDQADAGDIVLVDKGVYVVSLLMKEGIIVVGEPGAVLRNDGQKSVVYATQLKAGTIAAFTIEHTGTSAEESRYSCIAVNGGHFFAVNCTVRKSAGHGVYLFGGTTATIQTCTIEDCAWDGISVQGAGTTPYITRVLSKGNKISGIAFSTETAGTADGNACTGNKIAGIRVLGKSTAVLKGNTCSDNVGEGILLAEGASPTVESNTCERNSIGLRVKDAGSLPFATGNVLKQNTQSGLYVGERAGGKFTLNVIEGNGLSGASVFGPDVNVRLEDNTIKANKSSGINISGGASVVCLRNVCDENIVDGIFVGDAGTMVTLEGNFCRNNKGAGIEFSSSTGKAVKNTCEGNDVAGILVWKENAAPRIEGNTCNANKLQGILIRTGAAGVFTGNTCKENLDCGIAILEAETRPNVKGNICNDNKKYGIAYWKGAAPVLGNNTATGNGVDQIAGLDPK